MAKTQILICDDHAVVRSGIKLILEQQPDFSMVGEAADAETAIRMTAELKPHIVIMDLNMPGMGGLAAIPRVLQAAPGVKLLVLTAHDDEAYFFKALKAGAMGYVLKGSTAGEIVAALYMVAQGGVAVPAELTRRVLADYSERPATEEAPHVEQLSEREQDVLRLVANGLSNKEIADKLFLSLRTVERHRTMIMNKLGLHGKAELMRYAVRRGMLELSD